MGTNNKKSRFQLNLDSELGEWIRDYRYARIRTFGDIDYSLHQVFIDALEMLRNNSGIEVVPRPEAVRKNEEKKKRKIAATRKSNVSKK